MHLSELKIITNWLNEYITGSVVKNVYAIAGGTALKLYGRGTDLLYFKTDAKTIFPADEKSFLPREEITNREESLRKYLKNHRIMEVKLCSEYGKLVQIIFPHISLFVPLFGGRPLVIQNAEGNRIWAEPGDSKFQKLEKEMRFIEPETEDPLAWQNIYKEAYEHKKAEIFERAVSKKRRQLEKKYKKLEQELTKSKENSTVLQQEAELIKAYLYSLDPHRKTSHVTVYNYEGVEQEIALDKKLTVTENMELMFKKAKKAKRGISTIEKLLSEAEEALLQLDDPEYVNALITKELNKKEKQKPADTVHKPFRQFQTEKERIFLVGKSSSDNDELTFKISSPHDLWFHARDYAGSHVIMRKTKGEIPTEDDIFMGCALALYYSRARKGMEGEVWYTERKFVVKRKGMAPGKVIIEKGKTKYVRTDENFLKLFVKG